MNGAEVLMKTAADAGITVCFANPGTTELPMVVALDSEPRIKPVLGLFEGVCTGAADGYGRMSGGPAMTILHLGPGLANGIANLHNAQRARTPILNIIGEHAIRHRSADPPLAMDIEALAGTVSGWYRANTSPTSLSQDMADAISASMNGQVASLIVPSDHQWAECDVAEVASPKYSPASFDIKALSVAVGVLKDSRKTALILGGQALGENGLRTAARIRAATGCDLLAGTFPAYVERGAGLPDVTRIPYFPEWALSLLSQYETVVLVGSREPVAFFGYNGFPSYVLHDQTRKVTLADENQDPVTALECLADALKSPLPVYSKNAGAVHRPTIPWGELTPDKACLVIAALQPEGAIIVDEGNTTSVGYHPLGASLPRHTVLTLTGGSLGYGMPCALGAAIACPNRPIVNIQADGSAMYTVQALWTQAHKKLNVTTLVCSNRSYAVLKMELGRAGIKMSGESLSEMLNLDLPAIDWVRIAEAQGVPGVSVTTAEELAHELAQAFAEPGPHLIEMILGSLIS